MSTDAVLLSGIAMCLLFMFLLANENNKLITKVAYAVLSNYRYMKCKKCGKNWNVSKHKKIEHGYVCPACAKKR